MKPPHYFINEAVPKPQDYFVPLFIRLRKEFRQRPQEKLLGPRIEKFVGELLRFQDYPNREK